MKARLFSVFLSLITLLKQTKFWLVLTIIIMGGFIIYLEGQIIDLETRLVAMQEGTDDNHFGPRISNLEYIINAHTETLHEYNKDIWMLDRSTNELNWRLNKMDWLTNTPNVIKSSPLTNEYLKDFNPNPKNVPLPQLTPEELQGNTDLPPITKYLVQLK